MEKKPQDRTPHASHKGGRPPYPLFKVVAAVPLTEIDGVVAGLSDAGFARDRIEVVTSDDVTGLDEPIGGSGIHGFRPGSI